MQLEIILPWKTNCSVIFPVELSKCQISIVFIPHQLPPNRWRIRIGTTPLSPFSQPAKPTPPFRTIQLCCCSRRITAFPQLFQLIQIFFPSLLSLISNSLLPLNLFLSLLFQCFVFIFQVGFWIGWIFHELKIVGGPYSLKIVRVK